MVMKELGQKIFNWVFYPDVNNKKIDDAVLIVSGAAVLIYYSLIIFDACRAV
jgi:hypothetical protein